MPCVWDNKIFINVLLIGSKSAALSHHTSGTKSIEFNVEIKISGLNGFIRWVIAALEINDILILKRACGIALRKKPFTNPEGVYVI